jgi:ribonuclease VapC
MFVDAAAIVAILSDEGEAERCAAALIDAIEPITSAIAV